MLILSRKRGESIVIDGRILVKVAWLDGDLVKLGIEAPSTAPVHRQEVYVEIQSFNQEAMTDTKVRLPRLTASTVALPISKGGHPSAESLTSRRV
ncbi:MAG TPA: carbon storage regulator [Candidatus Baltobacteraceae bacterium]|jgi:carbon storage regulator|nr:carbon storage regulator [Candidatus Baltobacteraceae bacterium]